MIFRTTVHNIGYSKDVASDGRVFENLSTCGSDNDNSTFRFSLSSDTVLDGAKDFQSIPKFAKMDLIVDYISTPKGSFFSTKHITVLK